MTFVVKSAAHVQTEFERFGLDTTRLPWEDDQTYVERMISKAPPDVLQTLLRSSTFVKNPPCECVECWQQFRTGPEQQMHKNAYSATLTWKEAQRKCDGWVDEINLSRAYLQNAIKNHGNTIVNRWKKKSVAKRASLLQEVFPELAHKKHEFVDRDYFELWQESRDKHRNFYMATYLTLDQLTPDPMKFLSLLNARAMYSAEEWVPCDVLQTRVGWWTGKSEVEYCDASVVMYGSKYGQIVEWKENQAHRWLTIGYLRAQLVLESQALFTGFLRRVIEQILVGVEIQSFSTRWNELVQTDLRRSRDGDNVDCGQQPSLPLATDF